MSAIACTDHDSCFSGPCQQITTNCMYCGLAIVGQDRICLVHFVSDDTWAEDNRAMCDLVHRGKTEALDKLASGG